MAGFCSAGHIYAEFLTQKIWCFYHKVNDFIKICCLGALLLDATFNFTIFKPGVCPFTEIVFVKVCVCVSIFLSTYVCPYAPT